MPDLLHQNLTEAPPAETAPVFSNTPAVRKSPKQGTGGILAVILLVSMLSATLSGITLWMIWDQREPSPPAVTEPLPLREGVDFINYRDRQLPISKDVPRSTYEIGEFSKDGKNWVQYSDGDITAIQGVDVSEYQGEINWKAVADDGIEFAMIRVGYRGYGESGIIKEDACFRQNIEGALAEGLDVGVYFFSQATTAWEAIEEAQFVTDAIHDYAITYPVVFDWEFITGRTARTSGMHGQTITLMANSFCNEIEQAGYAPSIYFNMDMGYLFLELGALLDYPFWLASYRDTPNFVYHYDMWQYTDKGRVDGITEPVDLNLAFRDLSADIDES